MKAWRSTGTRDAAVGTLLNSNWSAEGKRALLTLSSRDIITAWPEKASEYSEPDSTI